MTRQRPPRPSIEFELQERWNPPNPKKHPVAGFDALDFDYRLFPVSLYWVAEGKRLQVGHGGLLGLARDFHHWRRSKPRRSVLELPDLHGDGWMLRVERGSTTTSIFANGDNTAAAQMQTDEFDDAVDRFVTTARTHAGKSMPGILEHPWIKSSFSER